MDVNISLASYPGLRHTAALQTALAEQSAGELAEPALGQISMRHCQLVPQNFGMLDEETCDELQALSPDAAFRLHANVRVLRNHVIADLANFHEQQEWWTTAARLSKRLNATGYSAHSGSRKDATLAQMLDNAKAASDLFGIPVAIEGQYPTKEGDLLVNSWQEYEQVFKSGAAFALDLSHLNILAHKTKSREMELVREMLAAKQCLEVHLSDNNGTGDWHQVCENKPWWWELLPSINPKSVVFSEGNRRVRRSERIAA